VVLRTDLYAIAALAGAAIVVAGHLLHWPPVATTISGAVLCCVSSCASSRYDVVGICRLLSFPASRETEVMVKALIPLA